MKTISPLYRRTSRHRFLPPASSEGGFCCRCCCAWFAYSVFFLPSSCLPWDTEEEGQGGHPERDKLWWKRRIKGEEELHSIFIPFHTILRYRRLCFLPSVKIENTAAVILLLTLTLLLSCSILLPLAHSFFCPHALGVHQIHLPHPLHTTSSPPSNPPGWSGLKHGQGG